MPAPVLLLENYYFSMYQELINELYSAPLAITDPGLMPYIPRIRQVLMGVEIKDEKEPIRLGLFDSMMNGIDHDKLEDQNVPDSVAIIRISGLLTKFGSWWDYGTEEYAQLLDMAYADNSIKSIILSIHSPGGTVHSVFPMEEAIGRRNKPVFAVVNSNVKSAALYIAVLCDKIFAVNRMAEVGSIGVMAQIENDDKMMSDIGIKRILIVPPESKWKNKAYEEARKGKPDLFIKEELTPWAIHFQNIVKANRPNLDMSIDGLLEGREFYAYDGINNGFIDEIKPFNKIVKDAFTYNQDQLNRMLNK
jgi:protease-4